MSLTSALISLKSPRTPAAMTMFIYFSFEVVLRPGAASSAAISQRPSRAFSAIA